MIGGLNEIRQSNGKGLMLANLIRMIEDVSE